MTVAFINISNLLSEPIHIFYSHITKKSISLSLHCTNLELRIASILFSSLLLQRLSKDSSEPLFTVKISKPE